MKDATINRRVNEELKSITGWFQPNKLSLSLDKNKFIYFLPPNSRVQTITLRINNVVLERVTSLKFLSLTLNDNLTWKNHITSISLQIARVVGIMNKRTFCSHAHSFNVVSITDTSPFKFSNNVLRNRGKYFEFS